MILEGNIEGSNDSTASEKHNVLIIENEVAVVELLEIQLSDLNCNVVKAYDGLEGLEKARAGKYDLIILDLVLPKKDGTEVCVQLREEENFTPIFMVNAKSEKYDKLLGLEYGADAYMTSHFRIGDFIAQVESLLCRAESSACKENHKESEEKILKFGDLKLNLNSKRVTLRNQKIDLSCKEFDILSLLVKTPGKSYTRSEILQLIWGYVIKGYEHIVNTHISRLRSKIERDAKSPVYILTSSGKGYQFNEKLYKEKTSTPS